MPQVPKDFDWEFEPASLIAEQSHTIVNNVDGAGVGRGNKRWAFAKQEPVGCPWCGESVKPRLAAGNKTPVRKKVPLTVLLCPHCQSVWQYRGTVPDCVACPACLHEYEPSKGNLVEKGKFVCPHCGKKDNILNSIRLRRKGQLLPTSMYAIQGYCSSCGKDGGNDDAEEEDVFEANLERPRPQTASRLWLPITDEHRCLLAKSGGKFFKRIDPSDLDLYLARLPYLGTEKRQSALSRDRSSAGDKTRSGLLATTISSGTNFFCLGS